MNNMILMAVSMLRIGVEVLLLLVFYNPQARIGGIGIWYTRGNSFKRYMRTTKLSVSWCRAVSGPMPQANAKITMAFASLTDPRFDSSNSVRDSAPNTARWPYSSTQMRFV